MDKKICLDSDVCIDIINKKNRVHTLLKELRFAVGYISAISIFELNMRKTNLEKVSNFIGDLNILEFEEAAAIKASEILKELKSKGRMLDARDLFIAASCIVNNCALATLNKKHFAGMKELKIVDF